MCWSRSTLQHMATSKPNKGYFAVAATGKQFIAVAKAVAVNVNYTSKPRDIFHAVQLKESNCKLNVMMAVHAHTPLNMQCTHHCHALCTFTRSSIICRRGIVVVLPIPPLLWPVTEKGLPSRLKPELLHWANFVLLGIRVAFAFPLQLERNFH
ncbi:unnamed protein product [Ixodes persulcatus]